MIVSDERPQAGYRDLFRHQLVAQEPASVLDVGAGQGGLVGWLTGQGVDAAGVENDGECLRAGQSRGLAMHQGDADQLPFGDGSFDWVVSEFSLHHFPSAAGALEEALRVARQGVLILDQWFDLTLAHQRAARSFDSWCKERDRCSGMVHADSFDADAIHQIVGNVAPSLRYRLQTILTPVALPTEKVDGIIETYLAGHGDCCRPAETLAVLREQIAADGISDDGALLLTVWK